MRVLIVKTSSLGDIVHAFPVIAYLHAKGAIIDWVAEKECAPLVQRHPLVSQVYVANTKMWRKGKNIASFREFLSSLRKNQYDVLFDLQGNCKSSLCTFFARAKDKVGFGKDSVPEWPNLFVTNRRFEPLGQGVGQRYLSIATQYFGDDFPKKQSTVLSLSLEEEEKLRSLATKLVGAVMVCPCSRWPNKMLPEETWISFLQKIGAPIVFCSGSEDEKKFVTRLQKKIPNATVLEKLSLPLLQNAMTLAHSVISVDSLALHLAASAGVPTLSVFTASQAKEYAPVGQQSIQGTCPYNLSFSRRCPRLRSCQTGACRNTISTSDLLDAWKKNCFIRN